MGKSAPFAQLAELAERTAVAIREGGTITAASLDTLNRIGTWLQELGEGTRPDVYNLGTSLSDISRGIAASKLESTTSLGDSVRVALEFLANARSEKDLKVARINRLLPMLQLALRQLAPDLGLENRSVLVVDDDRMSREHICEALQSAQLVPIGCADAEEALEFLSREQPALILLDHEMPGMPGNQLLRRIRKEPRHANAPIVFVSGKKSLDVKLDAMRGGADDFVTKPFKTEELVMRVATRISHNSVLRDLAVRDPLTGLVAPRIFHQLLADELARHSRYENVFCLLLVDVDGLGAINESHGFDVGDLVLTRVGHELEAGARKSDTVSRLSGGEFGLIIPETNLEGAKLMLNRLLAGIKDQSRHPELPEMSVSVGVAGCPESTSSRRELIALARRALEDAKGAGPGSVRFANGAPKPAVVIERPEMEQKLAALFREEAAKYSGNLLGAGNGSVRDRATAVRRFAHFLAGTGATSGYPELSELGSRIEAAMDQVLLDKMPVGSEMLVADCESYLQRLAATLSADTYDARGTAEISRRLRRTILFTPPHERVELPGNADAPCVMVVDDDNVSHAAIIGALEATEYQAVSAYTAGEALRLTEERIPDLIIIDVMLPDLSGHELLKRLRRKPQLRLVPIIFVTARAEHDEKVYAIQSGADDYITKPFLADELLARVVSHLERSMLSRELAIRDALTGLYNHRYFQERLAHEVARATRYELDCCLAFVDIDDFKGINDTYGHQAGDLILREVAGQLAGRVRTSDVVARYGGEEFAIIYPETTLEPATLALERIREAVAEREHSLGNEDAAPLKVTISCGITEFTNVSKEELVRRADQALYEAKGSGKNRIVVAEPPES